VGWTYDWDGRGRKRKFWLGNLFENANLVNQEGGGKIILR